MTLHLTWPELKKGVNNGLNVSIPLRMFPHVVQGHENNLICPPAVEQLIITMLLSTADE